MRVAWVTRSFLDYRVPVFSAVDALLERKLHVVFSSDYVPERVRAKIASALGSRAVGLSGEWHLGNHDNASWANARVSFQYHPELLKAIGRFRPDVLIGDGFFKWTLALMGYKLLHRKPLVVCYERTVHTERAVQWYRNVYRRAVLRMVDAMCCSGQLCGEYVQTLGFPSECITYGHMVADVEGLQRASADISDVDTQSLAARFDLQGVVFLYVGQLVPRKGVKELLTGWRAFSAVRSLNDATLLLVGDGSQRAELEQYCAVHDLPNVRFAGHVDYDELPLLYRLADVLVMPTLEDNWSLVVPEGMACGLPVLCSKYNGCWPELVHPEVNGWVFDPCDSQDCAHKLKQCIESQDRYERYGESSREIVRQSTPDRAARSVILACENAVARCGRVSHSKR